MMKLTPTFSVFSLHQTKQSFQKLFQKRNNPSGVNVLTIYILIFIELLSFLIPLNTWSHSVPDFSFSSHWISLPPVVLSSLLPALHISSVSLHAFHLFLSAPAPSAGFSPTRPFTIIYPCEACVNLPFCCNSFLFCFLFSQSPNIKQINSACQKKSDFGIQML